MVTAWAWNGDAAVRATCTDSPRSAAMEEDRSPCFAADMCYRRQLGTLAGCRKTPPPSTVVNSRARTCFMSVNIDMSINIDITVG